MSELRHRTVNVNGIRLKLAEQGEGMPVVLCHGFPGLGYSYRHQMAALAGAGYRAVAPDMRGYGGSDAPSESAEYDHDHTVADVIGLLDELGAEKAVVVGHDFGAPVAWQTAVRHPERVAGVVSLSVPYEPRLSPVRPSEVFAQMAKDHFFHVHYFQTRGTADRELAANPRDFLRRVYYALSGGYRYLDIWKHPSEGNGYLDVLPEAPPLPWPWLSTEELEVYVAEFARTGFSGGLNWYRAIDVNWEKGAPWANKPVEVPALFVAGARDTVVEMGGPKAFERMKGAVRDLRGLHLVEGAGHWVQQEKPEVVNRLLLDFLAGLR